MVTIKQVAEIAGVTPSTVSIIINGKAKERKISKKTQDRVWDAIKTTGYEPNLSARKLRGSVANKPIIAVFWAADFRATYLARVLEGIQSHKLHNNYDIVLYPYTGNQLEKEQALRQANVFSGAIIANLSPIDLDYLHNTSLAIPVVLFNRNSDIFSTVTIENFLVGKKVAQLFKRKGHKNTAIIKAEAPFLAMSQRSEGFISGCNENGLALHENDVISGAHSYKGGAETALKFIKASPRPTSLFFDSDVMAIGALTEFSKAGLRVPEDLEIITVGSLPPENTEYSIPSLTVTDIPMEQMASKCLEILSKLIKHEVRKPIRIQLDSSIIYRSSFQL